MYIGVSGVGCSESFAAQDWWSMRESQVFILRKQILFWLVLLALSFVLSCSILEITLRLVDPHFRAGLAGWWHVDMEQLRN